MCSVLFILFAPFKRDLPNGGKYWIDALVEMGFENVGWTEDGNERVYVLQNSAYRLQGVGIAKRWMLFKRWVYRKKSHAG